MANKWFKEYFGLQYVIGDEKMSKQIQIKGLYGITYPYPGISTLESIKIMIEKGANFVQLGEKEISNREYFKLAKKALSICKKHSVKLIINDRVGVALALNLPIHAGRDDLGVKEIKNINKNIMVGYSISRISDVKSEDARYADYYGVGPIFYSALKPSKKYFGIEGLKKLKRIIKKPIVAIGGVHGKNLDSLLKLNPDCIGIMFYKFMEFPRLIEKINKFYGGGK